MYQKEHGKNAKVAGYRIGGKTGTSEDGVNTNKYVTSFCGVAPIDNPQVVVLVTLYNPTGEGGHQGGAWFILSLQYRKCSKKFFINYRFLSFKWYLPIREKSNKNFLYIINLNIKNK